MPQSEEALLIFIKNPEKGKVKTRLAATVGDEKALNIYKSLLAHTRDLALEVPVQRLLFYSENISLDDDWSADSFNKELQATGGLGERIHAAFLRGFEIANRVMIIGSDCPKLDSELVRQAYAALDNHDYVLGPALDGGYYLLGMKSFSPSLFQGIAWSTDQVAAQTRQRIQALQGSCHEMPVLSDIDYEVDWNEHGWTL